MPADPSYNAKIYIKQDGSQLIGASGSSITMDSGSSVSFSGSTTFAGPVTSTGTIALGYATGAGGSATQSTNRSTSVTVNAPTGNIVTDSTSLAAAAEADFKVANSTVAATDVVIVCNKTASAKGSCVPSVVGVGAGAFTIRLTNLHASEADDATSSLNFAVIKGAAS